MRLFIYINEWVNELNERMNEWKNNSVQKSQLPTGKPVGCIQSKPKELNSGKPRINPESSSLEGLKLGPPEYKSSALTTPPYCLDLTLVTSINSVEINSAINNWVIP